MAYSWTLAILGLNARFKILYFHPRRGCFGAEYYIIDIILLPAEHQKAG